MFPFRVHFCNYGDLPQLIFPYKNELMDSYETTILCVCVCVCVCVYVRVFVCVCVSI